MSNLSFTILCCGCYSPILQKQGYVFSCGDFICEECYENGCYYVDIDGTTKDQCIACGKQGIKKIALGVTTLPDEVKRNLSDTSRAFDNLQETLLFQIKYYKTLLRSVIEKLRISSNQSKDYQRRISELEDKLARYGNDPYSRTRDISDTRAHESQTNSPSIVWLSGSQHVNRPTSGDSQGSRMTISHVTPITLSMDDPLAIHKRKEVAIQSDIHSRPYSSPNYSITHNQSVPNENIKPFNKNVRNSPGPSQNFQRLAMRLQNDEESYSESTLGKRSISYNNNSSIQSIQDVKNPWNDDYYDQPPRMSTPVLKTNTSAVNEYHPRPTASDGNIPAPNNYEQSSKVSKYFHQKETRSVNEPLQEMLNKLGRPGTTPAVISNHVSTKSSISEEKSSRIRSPYLPIPPMKTSNEVNIPSWRRPSTGQSVTNALRPSSSQSVTSGLKKYNTSPVSLLGSRRVTVSYQNKSIHSVHTNEQ